MRRDALLALGLLALGFALTLWLDPWADQRINDLFVYRSFADPVLHGHLPYRDAFLEYPPLAAPAIALPGLLGLGEDGFRLAFAGWTLLLAALVVLETGALAALTAGDRRRALVGAALAPLLLGAVVRTHFDLAPVALLLAALMLLARERPRAGFALLGLGTMTKVFPLVAAPVALAWLAGRGRRRQALAGGAVLGTVVVALAGLAIALSPSGARESARYQLDRPVQVESAPALVLLGLDAAGAGKARHVVNHRSDGLEHPASGAVSAVFTGLLLATIALLSALAARAPRDGPSATRALVLCSLTAVMAFAAFGRVLSPQYLIWTAPLAALALAWRAHLLAGLIALASVLTFIEFPAHYFDVVARDGGPLALVIARDTALIAAVGAGVRAARRLAPARSPALSRPAG